MSASEHPEEALERAISGTLSLHERRGLEQHLAVCAACKAHLALASMALHSFQPLPRDEAADRSNVERAMALASRPNSPRRAQVARRVLWLAAAALLAMAGLAAAAWLRTAATPAAHVQANAAVSQMVIAKAAVPQLPHQPPPSEAPQPIPEPEATTAAASAVNAPLAAPTVTASGLFRKASALRANGESEAAIATFFRLQQLFPQSRESKLSLMIAGSLLLERGSAARALEEFDHYLSQSGSASEHALAGRASALQSLGRSEAEASAWQRLLTAYPKSVYEQRAKARLSQLRATP